MKRLKGLLLLFVLAAVGAVAWALWPRPLVERYISPPVMAGGGQVRLEVLIPVGWRVHLQRPTTSADRHFCPLWAGPEARMQGWPPPIRRWMHADAEDMAILQVFYDDWGKPSNGLILFGGDSEVGPDGITVGNGNLGQRMAAKSHGRFQVQYERSNRDEFDATYRQICESFRVVR